MIQYRGIIGCVPLRSFPQRLVRYSAKQLQTLGTASVRGVKKGGTVCTLLLADPLVRTPAHKTRQAPHASPPPRKRRQHQLPTPTELELASASVAEADGVCVCFWRSAFARSSVPFYIFALFGTPLLKSVPQKMRPSRAQAGAYKYANRVACATIGKVPAHAAKVVCSRNAARALSEDYAADVVYFINENSAALGIVDCAPCTHSRTTLSLFRKVYAYRKVQHYCATPPVFRKAVSVCSTLRDTCIPHLSSARSTLTSNAASQRHNHTCSRAP